MEEDIAMSKNIYLDYNATCPVLPEVMEAMLPYFTESFGNPSSAHSLGQDAREAVEDARESVARLLGADSREIFFTGGGSESDNLAIKGYIESLGDKGVHIITTMVEHNAVLHTAEFLEAMGLNVTFLGVDDKGQIDLKELEEVIRDETRLASIMFANNETGTIFDIESIGEILKRSDVLFHTDAVQASGKVPIDVKRAKIDMLSISGHKMGAQKGVGALYIRDGIRPISLIHGGGHESGLRAGTENVPGIVGLGKAADIAIEGMDGEMKRLSGLRDMLEKGLIERIDHISINGDIENRLSNTTNISFGFVEGESILVSLDMVGIFVSSGSACSSKDLTISHVLRAMGKDPIMAQGAIRFSLGERTTEEDIKYVLETLPPIIERLRGMSPLYPKK